MIRERDPSDCIYGNVDCPICHPKPVESSVVTGEGWAEAAFDGLPPRVHMKYAPGGLAYVPYSGSKTF